MQGARCSWLLIFWTWEWWKCIKKRLESIWHEDMMASMWCVHMLLQTAVTIKKTCRPQTMWRIHAHKNSKLRSWPHHDSKQKPESEAEARPLLYFRAEYIRPRFCVHEWPLSWRILLPPEMSSAASAPLILSVSKTNRPIFNWFCPIWLIDFSLLVLWLWMRLASHTPTRWWWCASLYWFQHISALLPIDIPVVTPVHIQLGANHRIWQLARNH